MGGDIVRGARKVKDEIDVLDLVSIYSVRSYPFVAI